MDETTFEKPSKIAIPRAYLGDRDANAYDSNHSPELMLFEICTRRSSFMQAPNTWLKTSLGEIAEPTHERASPREFPDMPYIGLEHIESKSMSLVGSSLAGETSSSSLRFYRGNVLYARMRPYLNKVWVASFDGLCSPEFLVFPNTNGLDNEFLAYRLNAQDFVDFANSRTSGERPRVDFRKLSGFPLALPPTAEQSQIAQVLADSFARLHRAASAATRAKDRLVRYRNIVLEAAMAGELTKAWRESDRGQNSYLKETANSYADSIRTQIGDHARNSTSKPPSKRQQPPEWTSVPLENLASSIRNGISEAPREKSGLPILRISAVRPLRIDLTDCRYLPKTSKTKYASYVLREGDLLFIRYNGTKELAGASARIPHPTTDIVHPDKLIRASFSDHFPELSAFVEIAVNTGSSRSFIEAHLFTTAGQWGISGKNLRNTPIPFCNQDEQRLIVRDVQAKLAAAEKLRASVDSQLLQSDTLRQSILNKAFSGSLTKQKRRIADARSTLSAIESARQETAKERIANRKREKEMTSRRTKRSRRRLPLLDVLKESRRPITPEELFSAAGFEQDEIDEFYRQLKSIMTQLVEEKPSGSAARTWPNRASVRLRLRQPG